jgi:uncharacterized membrane protein (UPF0127 family)
MLASGTAKTVSARNRAVLLAVGGFALVIAVILSILNLTHQSEGAVMLKSGGERYSLMIASTPVEQALGLGKRSSLPTDQGMLFIFNRPAVRCFWMKDMHFSLDMIWLSNDKRVEYVMANISPATYPKAFCPNAQAKYVIELDAGQAKRADIHTGTALDF